MFFRVGLLWSIAAILLLAAVSPPLQAQDYIPLDGLRVSDGRVQFGFASAGQCIQLSNSSINGVVYTTHTSKWQRRAGSSWVDIPGTERNGLCSYSPTSLGEYRLVAEISINGERGHYSSENTLTVEGAPGGTGPAGTESFSFPDLGGWFATSSGTEETVRVGYGRISADVGSTTPSGIAIFQYRDSQGVLIAEASVPATELIQEGRIFAEVEGPVNTGLAIANPNDVPATIRFYFTDTTGTNLGSGNFELGEHEQTAKFLNQEPFNEALPDGSPVLGTFTFESSVPIAVIALRGFTNEADEFLMTTLPVAPLSPASEETVYIPHFAAGGGWVTQVILVNPTDSTIAGTVGFLGPGSGTAAASPVILTLGDGSTGSDFDYSIPPRSSQRFTTSNPFGALNSGSVRAVPDSGNAAPSGLVVFSYAPAGKTLSEAGVPALPKGSAFRVYAEASGMPGQMGSISTGLAITNVGNTSNTVTLEVTHLDGSLAAAPEMLTLPPSGQVARFLNDIFSLPDNFSGVLRVTSTADIAIVALRLRVNENGEIKVTTLAPSNEMDPPASESSRFFAHIADSGGWSTQFILFSGTAGQAASGTLSFIDTAGQPWDLTTDSGVSGSVPPSGGAYADLVLASASVSSATPMAGQPFELRANVDNRGTGASTATTLRFYRSTDTTISSIDTEVGTDAVSALAAGGTSSSVLMLTALSSAGTYYYGACVDPVSGESDTGNNCSSAVTVTVGSSDGLAPTRMAFESSTPAGYTSVTLSDEGTIWGVPTKYTSDSDAGTMAYMLLGRLKGCGFANAEADRQSKVYIRTESLGRLDNFESETVCRKTSSQWTTSWLGVRMTHLRFFDESSPTNTREAVYNSATGEIEISDGMDGTQPEAPDLAVQTPSVSDDSPDAGESFTLSATVRNQGNGQSAPTTLRYYRSTDAMISAGDTEVGTGAVSGLSASGTSSGMITVTAPSTAATYYYGACIDAVSGESDTGNNCSGAVSVTVTTGDGSGGSPTGESFDLASENGSPEGITFANNRFYVVDDLYGKVYAYHASGQRDAASDFDLDSDNHAATGITFANGSLYVVNRFEDKVYAYHASGQRDAASDFDLDPDNGVPFGITFANGRFHVVDWFYGKVYAYHASGQRDAASDFDLDPDNGGPFGITFANGRFHVVDWTDDKVYAYHASGQRDAASDFDLDPDNGFSTGITFANGSLYVVDGIDGKVYLVTSRTSSSLAFSDGETTTRSIPENIPAGINVGVPVSAVGGDSLTYTISGTDSESFVILPETGQIRTRENVVYDYEVKNRYAVTVGVEDDDGNSDTIDVTILIGDLVPSCGPPSNIRVNHSDGRLTLRWSPLSDMIGRARVLGYQTEIRRGTSGAWSDRRTFLGRNIDAMIYAGLDNEIEYQVRVRPINAEGDCSWSTPVSGIPTADRAPKDDDDHHDRFGPYPVGTPERNLRLLTPGRCRHTSNGQTLDADCAYENTGPDSGRIFLEFDDPSQGSCEITLAYSSLTAGSFIDECFDAGVNTNVPFDRSFRMPPLSEQDGEVEVPRAPRSQEEFDVLAWGRDDFIPGLGFGCPPGFEECEFSPGNGYTVGRDSATGLPLWTLGEYTYMNTGPSTGVLTFRDDFGGSYTFTLDFGRSGSVRATIEAPSGGASVWPGMPHLNLTLGAQPVLLPIPPSWSAAIAIETDVAPDDWDGLEDRIPTPRSPVHPISPRDSLLERTLFEGLANAVAGGGDYGNNVLSYTSGYEKLGRNRATISFDFREQYTDDYDRFDQLQQTLIGSIWVFDLTFTSDGAAKYTLTITKDGHLPTVLEGVVDFHGDGINVDEFPEEILLPDDPPQASGEDRSGVEVAAAVSTTRIGPDDLQTFLVNDPGLQTAAYSPGDWLEPKDGSNQRMMIVGAAQVSAARAATSSRVASPQLDRHILKMQTTVSAHASPIFAEAVALLGKTTSRPAFSTSTSTITQLSVVCMQLLGDIPARGARYFSQPKAAQDAVQLCQQKCVLDGMDNIQGCVWRCEANAAGN